VFRTDRDYVVIWLDKDYVVILTEQLSATHRQGLCNTTDRLGL